MKLNNHTQSIGNKQATIGYDESLTDDEFCVHILKILQDLVCIATISYLIFC